MGEADLFDNLLGKTIKVKVVHITDLKPGDEVLWANLKVKVKSISKEGVLLGEPINEITNYLFYYVVEEVER